MPRGLAEAAKILRKDLALKIGAVPLSYDGKILTLAVVPNDVVSLPQIEKLLASKLNLQVIAVQRARDEVERLINECYHPVAADEQPAVSPLADRAPAENGSMHSSGQIPQISIKPRLVTSLPQTAFETMDFTTSDKKAVEKINRGTATRYDALPLKLVDGTLYVGLTANMVNDQVALDVLRKESKSEVIPVQMEQVEILRRLKELYPQNTTAVEAVPPTQKIVQEIWTSAVLDGTSDVHFDAVRDGGKIYFSIEGELYPYRELTKAQHAAVISSIMLVSGMDTGNKLIPQAGRVTVEVEGKNLDIRIQTTPSIHATSMVARIMPSNESIAALDERGMLPNFLDRYTNIISQPYGLILISGPMGSGKSNTMYSTLLTIKDEKKSFRSVENPVEMQLPWVQQTSLRDEDAFGFAEALTAFVRLNPSVMIIGEMRDEATAKKGLEAAMLGHLVFTTTHGNNSALVIQRLTNMGVGRDDIAAALSAVLAQRLVRRLCVGCRVPSEIPSELQRFADSFRMAMKTEPKMYRARGCDLCRDSGYQGRIGIFELLEVSDSVSRAILDAKHASDVLRSDPNFQPMIIDGLYKVFMGLTSVEQIRKIVRWNLDDAYSYLPQTLKSLANAS